MVDSRASNVTFEDCEVNGAGVVQSGFFLPQGPVTVRRCEVSNVGDGVQVGDNVTIVDSFLHGMSTGPRKDWHTDTIQLVGGRNLSLLHNTIINEQPQTAAVGVWSDLGPVDNVLVENNLIAGGGYSVYVTRTQYDMTNVRVINNHFSTIVFARVSYWATESNGYDGLFYPTNQPASLVKTGNVYHESGAPVTK
jgi:hypothetical protein